MCIKKELEKRILVLDGGMGSMIKSYNLYEKEFRGQRFQDCDIDQKGNNDLLTLTQSEIIIEIHQQFILAGSDIIETNTFNSNSISMEAYSCEKIVYELNHKAVLNAKQAIINSKTKKKIWIAGSIGPTNKSCLQLFGTNDDYCFDDMLAAYTQQIEALVDGGVDILLIETIVDTINAKAAVFAAENVLSSRKKNIPIMLSLTFNTNTGLSLSGQTIEAFVSSFQSERIISIGFNCVFGDKDIFPFVYKLSSVIETYLSVYLNAGLPDKRGKYMHSPNMMICDFEKIVSSRKINIIGGCCGTSPKHIEAIANFVENKRPRKIIKLAKKTRLCGKELLTIDSQSDITIIIDIPFLNSDAILDEHIVSIRKHINLGSKIIKINVDSEKIDIHKLLKKLVSDSNISRLPFMICASKWEDIEAALKCIQGKAIVNYISMEKGEDDFLRKAIIVKRYSAALLIRAEDKHGYIDDLNLRNSFFQRVYHLLIDNINFNAEDIIFDITIYNSDNNTCLSNSIENLNFIKLNLPYAKSYFDFTKHSFDKKLNSPSEAKQYEDYFIRAEKAGLNMAVLNLNKFD